MKPVASSFILMLSSWFRTRASMQIEILALRHQLAVLQRWTKKRASLRAADRFWVILSRLDAVALGAGHRQAGNSKLRGTELWGAPRIHGELLKLGIEISQATVAKYMVRQRKPPSQRWRTFLENHIQQIVATDSGSNDVKLSLVVCVCSLGPPPASRHSLQRHVPSEGRMDGTAIAEAFPWDSAPVIVT